MNKNLFCLFLFLAWLLSTGAGYIATYPNTLTIDLTRYPVAPPQSGGIGGGGGGGGSISFPSIIGTASDAQIPDLNSLSTGLTPSRCVQTDSFGLLTVSGALCNPTNPTITDFSNAQHNHTGVVAGGQLTDAALSTAITIAKGGTGATSASAARTTLAVPGLADANVYTSTNKIGATGTFSILGSTSGEITIGRAANAGTFNFNLPQNAGSAGQPLLSGGGGSNVMTFATLGIGAGGTGVAGGWVAARCVRVNNTGTALEPASSDCVAALNGSGTLNKHTRFTGTSSVGDSLWSSEDASGLIVAGSSRFGSTGTNDYTPVYTSISGHITRNMKNVNGDEAVTTGTLTNGNFASYNPSGQLIDSGKVVTSFLPFTGTLTNGNLASFDASSQIVDSGKSVASTLTYSGSLTNGNAAIFNASSQIVDGGLRTKSCIIENDTQSATALTNAQITGRCDFDQASTVLEVAVFASSGTPSVLMERWRPNGGAVADLTTAALATAASGGYACSKTTGVAGIAGITCTNTLQNTALNAGDVVRVKSATAGGTATWHHVKVTASY